MYLFVYLVRLSWFELCWVSLVTYLLIYLVMHLLFYLFISIFIYLLGEVRLDCFRIGEVRLCYVRLMILMFVCL
jgi:hypothetical protein